MAGSGKRVDLRFGAFACSVQGFDDPIVLLARMLREVRRTLADAPVPGEPSPLFDADTLRRLEAEIAGTADGGTVSAMPGLVLTWSDLPPSHAEAALPDDTTAQQDFALAVAPATDPEDFGARLRAAITQADDEAEIGDADLGRNIFAAPEEPDEATDPYARMRNIFASTETEAGPEDEPPPDFAEAPADETATANQRALQEPPAEPEAPHPNPAAEAPEADPAEAIESARIEPALPETPPEPANIFDLPDGEEHDPEDRPNLFASDYDPDGRVCDEYLPPDNVTPFTTGLRDRGGFKGYDIDDDLGHELLDEDLTAAALAQKARASAVHDLIGASAAWLTLVRGHASFSRREVLEVFDEIPGGHPRTGEAKIKGWGKLLRSGQIRPMADHRFGLSAAERDRYEGLIG